jgi:hypothetical protein
LHGKRKVGRCIAAEAWDGNVLIFCTGGGGLLQPSNLDRSFQRLVKAAPA